MTNDFMDSYEENDEIGTEISKKLKDHDVGVAYHEISDGRHRVYIDGEMAFNIDTWNTKEELNVKIEEWIRA